MENAAKDNCDSGQGLEPNQQIKPPFKKEKIPDVIKSLYGMTVKEIKQMNSYDDLTFHIKVEGDHVNPSIDFVDVEGYTFKVTNWLDTQNPGFLESIQDVQRYLHSKGIAVPLPINNLNRDSITRISLPTEGKPEVVKEYAIQLLSFLPGTTLINIPFTADVLFQCGFLLSRLAEAYQDFRNPVLEKRSSHWSLFGVPRLSSFLFAVQDQDRHNLARDIIEDFKTNVLPVANKMPRGVIHGDVNEHNIIVRPSEPKGTYDVYGVLDFTDNHAAPQLFEVAVALTYSMIECTTMDQLLAPGHVLAGYLSKMSLTQQELTLIKACVEARLVQSLVYGAYSFHQDPGNLYVLSTSKRGWDLLKKLRDADRDDLLTKWKEIVDSYNK